jgi:hypothetical protein
VASLQSVDFCFFAPVLWSFLFDSDIAGIASLLQHTAERYVASDTFQELLCLSAERRASDPILESLQQHGASWTALGIYGWTPSMCAQVSDNISPQIGQQQSSRKQNIGLPKPEKWRAITSQQRFDFSDGDREAVVRCIFGVLTLSVRVLLITMNR